MVGLPAIVESGSHSAAGNYARRSASRPMRSPPGAATLVVMREPAQNL
jgi:hypothetical protein